MGRRFVVIAMYSLYTAYVYRTSQTNITSVRIRPVFYDSTSERTSKCYILNSQNPVLWNDADVSDSVGFPRVIQPSGSRPKSESRHQAPCLLPNSLVNAPSNRSVVPVPPPCLKLDRGPPPSLPGARIRGVGAWICVTKHSPFFPFCVEDM